METGPWRGDIWVTQGPRNNWGARIVQGKDLYGCCLNWGWLKMISGIHLGVCRATVRNHARTTMHHYRMEVALLFSPPTPPFKKKTFIFTRTSFANQWLIRIVKLAIFSCYRAHLQRNHRRTSSECRYKGWRPKEAWIAQCFHAQSFMLALFDVSDHSNTRGPCDRPVFLSFSLVKRSPLSKRSMQL